MPTSNGSTPASDLRERAYRELVTCDYHGKDVKRAVLDEVFEEVDRLRQQIAEAALAIPIAGPLPQRIFMLRREFARFAEKVREGQEPPLPDDVDPELARAAADCFDPAFFRGEEAGVHGVLSVLNRIREHGKHGRFGDPALEELASWIATRGS